MDYGVSAQDQLHAAEERRQRRRVIVPGSEHLTTVAPVFVRHLNANNGSGVNARMFVLGLDDPFNPNLLFPAP